MSTAVKTQHDVRYCKCRLCAYKRELQGKPAPSFEPATVSRTQRVPVPGGFIVVMPVEPGDYRTTLPGERALARESWKRATGFDFSEYVEAEPYAYPPLPPELEPEELAAQRALHAVPCDVPWCTRAAVLSWQRTPQELKLMRKGARTGAPQAERRVCNGHAPAWRVEYVPLGEQRKIVKPRYEAKRCPHCGQRMKS